MCLRHSRKLRVSPAGIALPVGVFGDVGGGQSDGIVVGCWVESAGGWVAELRVHGDTSGAFGVDGEEAVNPGVDSRGLDGVFLRHGQDSSYKGAVEEGW